MKSQGYGGDEFAVILQSDTPDAYAAMERIQDAIDRESDCLSVSMGGVVWGTNGDSLETCYQVADTRMYERKRRKKIAQNAAPTRRGLLLVSYWSPIGLLLVSYWSPIGLLLVSYWSPIGLLLVSYWSPLGHSYVIRN